MYYLFDNNKNESSDFMIDTYPTNVFGQVISLIEDINDSSIIDYLDVDDKEDEKDQDSD